MNWQKQLSERSSSSIKGQVSSISPSLPAWFIPEPSSANTNRYLWSCCLKLSAEKYFNYDKQLETYIYRDIFYQIFSCFKTNFRLLTNRRSHSADVHNCSTTILIRKSLYDARQEVGSQIPVKSTMGFKPVT